MDDVELLAEAVRYFADPAVCAAYVRRFRWPGGRIVCPHCGGKRCTEKADGRRLRCRDCLGEFSYKSGTIFEDSPISLGVWFVVIWSEACGLGLGTEQIGGALGLRQKTAWRLRSIVRTAIEVGRIELKPSRITAAKGMPAGLRRFEEVARQLVQVDRSKVAAANATRPRRKRQK